MSKNLGVENLREKFPRRDNAICAHGHGLDHDYAD